MLGKKHHKNSYSLGLKNNKRGSMIGHKIYPINASKNGLISYHNNEPKKSYLEK